MDNNLLINPKEVIKDQSKKIFFNDKNRAKLEKIVNFSTDEARALLTLQEAKRYQCLPLQILYQDQRKILSLLIVKNSADLLQEIRFIVGCDLIVEEYEEGILLQAITACYLAQEQSLSAAQHKVNQKFLEHNKKEEISLAGKEEVPQLLEAIIFRASYLAASDIHLEPTKEGLRLRYRIDGLLRSDTSFKITLVASANLIRRIKILSNLDITINNKPQEGVFSLQLENQTVSLRVSFIPQAYAEKVVLRIHNNNQPDNKEDLLKLSELGLDAEQELLLVNYLSLNSGAILLSGPTGSGKSTLLYAMLNHLNQDWRNIITLEDPIEKNIKGINQTQVAGSGEITYSKMLPKLLRQDPDVIMLGEIREEETAVIAFTAAITGHLVLSTIHAGNCFEVITRLKQFNLQPEIIASSLKLIISQRLLPLNCKNCLEYQEANEQALNFFKLDKNIKLKTAKGCSLCKHTAILGRLAVFEFLPINLKLQEIFYRNSNTASLLSELRDLAFAQGFIPYAFKVREALINGEISLQTAWRILGVAGS